MDFRTRTEIILARDPLSVISLAFLSFTEEMNMHERNKVGKHGWVREKVLGITVC